MTDALGLAALVFVPGLKHGLDPDHLVAIDGFTRSTRSRWCGLFFSLGHGVVVTLVGVGVARLVRSADQRAAAASRIMSIAVAFLCLALAGLGVAKYPASLAPLLSAASFAVVLAAYFVARHARPVLR